MRVAFIEILLKQAQRRMEPETTDMWGFIPADRFGGNYDDAYWGGTKDGETGMARAVLKELAIPYTVPKEED